MNIKTILTAATAGTLAVGLMAAPALAQEESSEGVPPPTMDSDGDGAPDAWDRDGDGRADAWDKDGDGAPDVLDQDGDGNPDDSPEAM